MISPNKKIIDITQAQHLDAENLIRGIRNNKSH